MGRTIHSAIEVRDKHGWHAAYPLCVVVDEEELLMARDDGIPFPEPEPVCVFRMAQVGAQNTSVMNMIASDGALAEIVRKSWGGPVVPLRGLPDDLSREHQWYFAPDAPGEDAKQISWVTLKELLAFDWTAFDRDHEGEIPRILALLRSFGPPEHVRLIVYILI